MYYNNDKITHDQLRGIISYDPDTGIFLWIKARGGKRAGSIAGHVNNCGYLIIRINGIGYMAHRLAYLYMTGSFPIERTDHKDLDKTNNRWNNIREATSSENVFNISTPCNNTSGYKGVYYDKNHSRWVAQGAINNKQIYIGSSKDIEVAKEIRRTWAKEHHGEFYNEGNK